MPAGMTPGAYARYLKDTGADSEDDDTDEGEEASDDDGKVDSEYDNDDDEEPAPKLHSGRGNRRGQALTAQHSSNSDLGPRTRQKNLHLVIDKLKGQHQKGGKGPKGG